MLKKIKFIFLICVGMVAAFDLLTSYVQALSQITNHTPLMHSLSYEFTGMDEVLKNVRKAGYLTDKRIESDSVIPTAEYEQAQYVVAPTVLELNNPQWHWNIVNCTTPELSMAAVKHFGLTPLKAFNNIILTNNPNGLDQ